MELYPSKLGGENDGLVTSEDRNTMDEEMVSGWKIWPRSKFSKKSLRPEPEIGKPSTDNLPKD